MMGLSGIGNEILLTQTGLFTGPRCLRIVMPSISTPALPAQTIPRIASAAARKRLAGFPILTITGPRQSGKTTLSRLLAPNLPYFSLEDLDTRALATEDPRAFLRQISDGAILDEGQRAPDLFSYLQGVVDSDRRMGRFILAGSSQFELIKTPKLYFCDSGLAAWFLGVRHASHIRAHPQRGALFENWVMTELLKAQTNCGIKPSFHFLRDKEGHEVDALIETAPDTFQAIEIKSGETIASDFFSGLDYWRAKLTRQTLTPWLIHGGTARQDREKATILPWNGLAPLLNQFA